MKRGLGLALGLWLSVAANAAPIYGICEHVAIPGFEHENCGRTFDMMKAAGVSWVRTDFLWKVCEPKPGQWEWKVFDETVARARERGVTVLPILCYNNDAYGKYAWEIPEAWCAYVKAVVSRYRKDCPVVEIWNEPNIFFWKPKPDARQYTELLKASYRAVKEVSPETKVLLGGMSEVPVDFLEGVYQAGGRDFFDMMNVHPYSWPAPPDGRLDVDLAKLKALMAKYGDSEKPIWITEHGWPTHRLGVPEKFALRAGLALARPGQAFWRIAYAAAGTDDAAADSMVRSLQEEFAEKGAAKAYAPRALAEALAAGSLDLVVLPFNEDFPAEIADALVAFVAKGGVVAEFGGYPFFYACDNGKRRPGNAEGQFLRNRLRLDVQAWWYNKDLPETLQAHVADRARAAGYKGDFGGCDVTRFFTARLLKPGDEMIPLLAGKDLKGNEAVGACVYRFDSDYKGALIVSCRGRVQGTSTEAQQAANLRRSLEIVKEAGVAAYFPYEFRASERDPFYSENHFGLVHRDFTPKPAWKAYAEAIQGGN